MTTLTAELCRGSRHACRWRWSPTTFIREDAESLMRTQVLPLERICGVETGGCPHTAIREDSSINLAVLAELRGAFPELHRVPFKSGGDTLAAVCSPELVGLTVTVIDAAAGQDIPAMAAQRCHARTCWW